MEKTISILGSTGSIGTQALDVARAQGYKVMALSAGSNYKLLEKQAREFCPQVVSLSNEAAAAELKLKLSDTNIKVLCGQSASEEIAAIKVDTLLNAIVGIAGLKPTLAAINAGNEIALSNKETLVAAGDIVMPLSAQKGVGILPVDSEHSAIFQCLQGVPAGSLSKILLTASGGPFFGKTVADLKSVTPEKALKHPNWDMGAKITIDSATLMNKGLEVIEAMHLFRVNVSDINIVVHRESIIHSAVELRDGAVIAQLGAPDMRLPIQYALTYPARLPCPGHSLSLTDVGNLSFYKPDCKTFRCLAACLKAAGERGLKPAAANGANEQAVAMFLENKISFLQIGELVMGAMEAQPQNTNYTISDVFEADKAAREYVLSHS